MTAGLSLSLAAAAIALATVAVLLVIRETHIRALNARVLKAVVGVHDQSTPFRDAFGWLSSLGMRYRRFYSLENLEQLRAIVQTSGFNPHRTMPILIGGKTVSMFLFPIIAALVAAFLGKSLSDSLIFVATGAVLGVLGPRWILLFLRRRFNAAVQSGTADAIDLLVVCCEAGMGLESGLERVAQEMSRSYPAMTRVLDGLLDDLRILPDRRDAFDNLTKRSTAEGLRRFGTMINQSLQYGTPLSSALRAIADELRRERMIKLEERAHKLGAKLIIPMVLFMLPAMFVILGGSSFLHLIRTFKSM
jgi:tight adherence protein C